MTCTIFTKTLPHLHVRTTQTYGIRFTCRCRHASMKLLASLIFVGMAFTTFGICSAQTISDNFDDGNDEGWIAHEVVYAGNRDVTDGAYRLTTDDPVLVRELGHVVSRFDSEFPVGDGFVRAKVSADTQGTSAGIALFSDSDPPEYYVFNGSSQGGGFNVFRSNGQAWLPNLMDSDRIGAARGLPRFRSEDEWWLELGLVDGLVSAKAWQDGSSIPEEPQFTFLDTDPHSIATFGVAGWISTGWLSPVRVDATFDDVSFVPWREFDCNLDGLVNIADADCSSSDNLDATLQAANLTLGDLDGDGSVGFEDFLKLSQAFGSPGKYTDGDLDLSGEIEFADFLIFANNFGQSAAAISAVPEPEGIAWWFVVAFAGLVRTRRQPTKTSK